MFKTEEEYDDLLRRNKSVAESLPGQHVVLHMACGQKPL